MSFLSTLLGNDAATASRAAAADTYANQQAAAGQTKQAGSDYLTGMLGVSQAYNPYVQGGTAAQNQVYNLMGLNGAPAQTTAYGQFQTDPGYQFQLGQGIQAIDRSNAARTGGGVTGGTLKALQRYGTGLADQSYGNYLSRLTGLGSQGLQATGAQTGLQAQGYGGQLQANLGSSNQMYGSAGTLGQGNIAAANAKAAGAQNILNTGANLLGKVVGGYGGFGSSFGGGNASSGNIPGLGTFYPGVTGSPWG